MPFLEALHRQWLATKHEPNLLKRTQDLISVPVHPSRLLEPVWHWEEEAALGTVEAAYKPCSRSLASSAASEKGHSGAALFVYGLYDLYGLSLEQRAFRVLLAFMIIRLLLHDKEIQALLAFAWLVWFVPQPAGRAFMSYVSLCIACTSSCEKQECTVDIHACRAGVQNYI